METKQDALPKRRELFETFAKTDPDLFRLIQEVVGHDEHGEPIMVPVKYEYGESEIPYGGTYTELGRRDLLFVLSEAIDRRKWLASILQGGSNHVKGTSKFLAQVEAFSDDEEHAHQAICGSNVDMTYALLVAYTRLVKESTGSKQEPGA